jgi:hypothetical protein
MNHFMNSKNKKTLLAISTLLLFTGLTIYAVWKKSTKSTFGGTDTEFAVTDTGSVDKIFIAFKDNRPPSTLTRKADGTGWRINDRFDVLDTRMKMLLRTIHGIKVRRPVAEKERESAITSLATDATKVEVYQNDELVKAYYVGVENNYSDANYCIIDGFEDPYLVHLPGLNGVINVRFNVSEASWRDTKLFNSPSRSIKRLEVFYYNDTANSYVIDQTYSSFRVNGRGDFDTAALVGYLYKFGKVYAENILGEGHEAMADSIRLLQPTGFIDLQDTDTARSRKVTFYINPENPDILFGFDNKQKDLLKIQHFVFDPLLYQRKAFFKK